MPSAVQLAVEQYNRGRRKPRTPRTGVQLSAPIRLENAWVNVLNDIVQFVADDLRLNLIPELPGLVDDNKALDPRNDTVRLDFTIAQKIALLIATTRGRLESSWPDREVEAEADKIAAQLDAENKAKVSAAFRSAVGIPLILDEPWLARELTNFSRQNAALVKNVTDQFMRQTEETVFRGLRRGLRHEEIAQSILGTAKDFETKASRFSSAKSRIQLIARDQVNKLNGRLTELRQTNAGIQEYRWRTVGDDRVRPSHRELNGKKYSWDKPPSVGHPGEDINCRCYAEPIFEV